MGGREQSLSGLLTQLLNDGVAVGRAEFALAKAKVTARVDAARLGVALLIAAAVVVLLALIVLTVGLMMALATQIGFTAAAFIVFAILMLLAGILGWFGRRELASKPQAIVEEVA